MGKIQKSMSADGSVRVCLIDSTDIVNEAIRIFNTSPVVSAALGRTLTAALLISEMMDKESGKVNIMIRGDGALGAVTAIAEQGRVKGYPALAQVSMPLKENGKLDVGGAIGKGNLTIIRENEKGEMWSGTSELITGEIAEDITGYFYKSEQIPTACALGVTVDKDYSCLASGGFLLQVMPGASQEVIDQIEENIKTLPPISSLIAEGKSLDIILSMIFGGFFYKVLYEKDADYYCDCSEERVLGALALLKKEEIDSLADENGAVEAECRFCDKKYHFDIDELLEKLKKF